MESRKLIVKCTTLKAISQVLQTLFCKYQTYYRHSGTIIFALTIDPLWWVCLIGLLRQDTPLQ